MIGYSIHGLPRPVGSEFRQRQVWAPRRYDASDNVPWVVSVVDTLAGTCIEAKNHLDANRIVAVPIEGHSEFAMQQVLIEARKLLDVDGWKRHVVQTCWVTGCRNPLPMWVHAHRNATTHMECLTCAARTVLACRECGAPDLGGYISGSRERVLRDQLCFTCALWIDRLTAGVEIVSDDWRMRSIGPGTGAKKNRGYGGAEWIITFADGRVVETDDLWDRGEIPEWFRDRFVPNATVTPKRGAP